MKAIILITGFALSLAQVPAFATVETETTTDSAATAPAAQTTPDPALHKYSAGMQIPVDGSSLKAFEKSLETIESQVPSAEYTSLTNAIDYLMVFNLNAKRDRSRLAKLLDGQTGEQIIGKVNWNKPSNKRK